MPHKNTNDDLPIRDINLLPDDLRSQEEKARKASGSKEHPYELRAPKKEKRRRTFLGLPIFGGAHWEETVSPSAKKQAPEAAPILRKEERPQSAPPQPLSMPTSIVDITPVEPIRVSPDVTRTSKARRFLGIRMPSFGRASRPAPLAKSGYVDRLKTPAPVQEQPRHYSLLGSTQETVNQQEFQAPGAVPMVGSVHSIPAPRPAPTAVAKKQKGLPKWLDIFSLIRSVFSFSKRPPKIKPLSPSVSSQAPLESVQMAVPQPPQPQSTGPQVLPSVPPRAMPLSGRPSSAAVTARHSFPWPRWLNIFEWLRFLGRHKKKIVSVPSPKPMHEPIALEKVTPTIPVPPPIPAKSIPVLPSVITPISPVMPSTTTPPIVRDIVPLRPMTPTVPASSVPPVWPQKPVAPNPVAPQGPSPIVPITPSPGTPEPPKKGGPKGFLFHLPGRNKPSSLPEASQVNLIPVQFDSLRSWRQLSILFLMSALITLGFAALLFGGLEIWRQKLVKETSDLDNKIVLYKNDIIVYSKLYEPQMSALANRIDVINALLKKHIYWTHFFALLEKYTMPDVYYDGVSASVNGTLNLQAHGASYETVTKELLLLHSPAAKEFVSSATISGATRSEKEGEGPDISFAIDITLNPDLFYYVAPKQN